MPLGNPIRKQNESRIISVLATEGQSVFTVEGGYIINQISVFRNGVRLSNSEDFTAGDGSTVTLNNEANIDDRIEFHVFDRFTVQNAIVGAASSQTISGDLVINGKIFGNLDVPSVNTGILTATNLNFEKGNISGDATIGRNLNVTGISTFKDKVHLLDDDKLHIGGAAGDTGDLQLFHDGSHSFIRDFGTGSLQLSGSRITMRNGDASSEYMFTADENGSVQLYYDNAVRLNTTPSGADVNGTLNVVGVTTVGKQLHVGTGVSIAAGGLNVTAGVSTVQALQATTGAFSDTITVTDNIQHVGDTNTQIRFPANDTFSVETGGSERLRIDSNGKLLLGITASTTQSDGFGSKLQIQGIDADSSSIAITRNSNGINPPYITFAKSRGTSVSSNTLVADDDNIGDIDFRGADGSGDFNLFAKIRASVDGTPGNGDAPGRLSFFTTADGAVTGSERVRITSTGRIGINATSPASLVDVRDTSTTAYPFTAADSGAYSYAPYPHEINIQNNDTGSADTFAGIHFHAGAHATNGYNSTARISAVKTGDYKADLVFGTRNTSFKERVRITAAGKVLIGHNSSIAAAASSAQFSLQVLGTSFATSTFNNQRYESGTSGPSIVFNHSRSSTIGNHTILQTGDELGKIRFYGSDGNDFDNYGAEINASVDASPGNNVMPGRLEFKTTTTGLGSPSERMRIDSQGRVKIHGVGATISNHALAITHAPLYLQTDTDITAVNSGEGGAVTGLFRMYDVSSSSGRINGIEIRNKNDGDIRLLNQDVNSNDLANFILAMPGSAGGIIEKIKMTSSTNAVKISGKKSSSLITNDVVEDVDIYVATETAVTTAGDGAGQSKSGLIRFHDKGSTDNRFHGIEIRNKNSGDVRVLNKDVGASNKADLVFVADNGSSTFEAGRFINAGGLTFNGDTAAANALDDYDEGTFVPTLLVGGSATGITYSVQSATYVKIGRVVTVNIYIALSNKGSNSGDVKFGNLPFPVSNDIASSQHEASGSVGYASNLGSNTIFHTVTAIHDSTTLMYSIVTAASSSVSHATQANLSNSFGIRLSCTYFTAT